MLGEKFIKLLAKKYEPSATVELKLKGYDFSFKTDDEGNAIQLFIGKKTENGKIKGERYTRTLKKDKKEKSLKIIGS